MLVRPPANMRIALLVLGLLAKADRCSLALMNQFISDVSPNTIRRAIKNAQSVFGVQIEYVRKSKAMHKTLPSGNSGFYQVTHWGCLDKDELLKHVETLIQQGLMD